MKYCFCGSRSLVMARKFCPPIYVRCDMAYCTVKRCNAPRHLVRRWPSSPHPPPCGAVRTCIHSSKVQCVFCLQVCSGQIDECVNALCRDASRAASLEAFLPQPSPLPAPPPFKNNNKTELRTSYYVLEKPATARSHMVFSRVLLYLPTYYCMLVHVLSCPVVLLYCCCAVLLFVSN